MKNVLITGASRGIGAECAKVFSAAGYRVFVNYNKSEKEAFRLCDEINGIPVHADISKSDDVLKMIDYIIKNYGKISILINNAGIALPQMLITDISEEEWNSIFNINVKGMFLVTKAVLPSMIHEKEGSIINISSIWGITGGSCEVCYSASKSAIIGFTKALSKEVGPSGVKVNCIAPGVIKTDMNNNLTDEDYEALKEDTPLEKIGMPDDIAKAALFLAEQNFITGEIINISGGLVI